MISVKDISVKKDNGDEIFRDVSFSVTQGESIVLLGDSGCGKSTILRTVLGGSTNWNGSISVNGIELSSSSVTDLRKQIAFIPQEPRLPQGTVKEYLTTVVNFISNRDNVVHDSAIKNLFELFLLPHSHLNSNTSVLSGGERQRVAIIAALLLDRPILIADEITSALDPKSKEAVLNHIFSLGKTVLSVSHDRVWIAKCDRTITIGEHIGERNE